MLYSILLGTVIFYSILLVTVIFYSTFSKYSDYLSYIVSCCKYYSRLLVTLIRYSTSFGNSDFLHYIVGYCDSLQPFFYCVLIQYKMYYYDFDGNALFTVIFE